MDSFKLINNLKSKITNTDTKASMIGSNIIKIKTILLIIFSVINIYTLYRTFKLNSKIEQIYHSFSNLNIVTKNNNNLVGIINNMNGKDTNNENILGEYIRLQNDFCENPSKYLVPNYEELITLTNFNFKDISYQIYVYKKHDNYMSNEIIQTGKYEPGPMSQFLEALEYYGKTRNISNNKDIFMLDVGGNIGAHTSLIGKKGYSVVTFEASPRNYYILKKNYCNINRNSNIILINKAVSNQERNCSYYSQVTGIGNGILLCDYEKNSIRIQGLEFRKSFEVSLTKLSNFIPYFSNKNLALIKLDIEGAEPIAIQDGIEFVNKLHVPFIFSEYNPDYIMKHNSDPKKFLSYFVDNGYKISNNGFFGEYFNSVEDVISGNLYFTYQYN